MTFLAVARLVRLPNVFTAFGNIAMALCAVVGLTTPSLDGEWWARAVLLLVASGCLYSAGMVWNDYFDLEEDRRDRPFRPLASGQISLIQAKRLGVGLVVVGWVCAAVDPRQPYLLSPTGAAMGIALVVAILAYDARLKRTPYGPLGMGLCRFLNVLLGFSITEATSVPWSLQAHIAGVIGLYIVGVTWFARTEEKRSNPTILKYALIVILVALVPVLAIPARTSHGNVSPLFPYLLVCFAFAVGLPAWTAVRSPTPQHVQRTIKRCILGLVALDALIASAFIGTWGLLVVLLLLPGMWLGRWVYST